MQFDKNTRVIDIIEVYPDLKKKLPELDSRLGIINTAVGKMFIRKATLEDVASKGGIDVDTVIKELKKLTEEQ